MRIALLILGLIASGMIVTVLVAWLIAITVNVYEAPVETAYTSGRVECWYLKRQQSFGSVWLCSARYQDAAAVGFNLAAGMFRVKEEDPTPLVPFGFAPPSPPDAYVRGEENAHEFVGQAHGWPMLSMWFGLENDYTVSAAPAVEGGIVTGLSPWRSSVARSMPQPRVMPLRPVWPGFAWNTVLFAALFGLVLVPSIVRRRLRRRRACCPYCGYPAGASTMCSECGHALPEDVKPSVADHGF